MHSYIVHAGARAPTHTHTSHMYTHARHAHACDCTTLTYTRHFTNTRARTLGGKLGFVEAVRVLFTRYRKKITVPIVLQIVQQLSGMCMNTHPHMHTYTHAYTHTHTHRALVCAHAHHGLTHTRVPTPDHARREGSWGLSKLCGCCSRGTGSR